MATFRPPRFRLPKARSAFLKLFLLFLVWTIIEAHISHYRIARTEREAKAKGVLTAPTRVYIASLHWNNEKILRSEWNKGVVELVKTFGSDNVFVSVYESGSWDDSKGALRELDQELDRLGVPRKIILDDETHKDLINGPQQEEGWITIPDGKRMPRRIPYLSKLRNLSLQPLRELAMKRDPCLNHVLSLTFSISSKPTTATTPPPCSLDFSKPPSFYDTFALRDSRGQEHASQTWPYFRSSKSRNAMVSAEPVRVSSCWNGIASLGIRGLRFRGIPDSLAALHLEASECCLIHADNPGSRTRGVYVNPAVRVGYNRLAYDAVHNNPTGGGGGGGSWYVVDGGLCGPVAESVGELVYFVVVCRTEC
ncbi:hypothetical protein CHGG_04228 [Chaetomium globosum CBS 148.51]|uniref:Uncharacterized protein n=1 Tax=Chaetomium globosum (strain ATCC 6205 / CBS 148.51 / DSM 1962 / NBRC 6347 / NRRL 1970) TaxID=306901 RepID=Q2H1W8_CHAGB|nr:uncharacterized protein CHGG_04228 [Chaetomium globosum CBS 148.51]EAQ87609.1 hypothetical protein CHGG_04228 [Chaetomium globosum CBS 148.51]